MSRDVCQVREIPGKSRSVTDEKQHRIPSYQAPLVSSPLELQSPPILTRDHPRDARSHQADEYAPPELRTAAIALRAGFLHYPDPEAQC